MKDDVKAALARATKAEAERDEAQRGEQEAWRQTDQMRAERDALRAQVEALERERDMLQTALRDNSAAHSETGKALLRAEAQVEAARAWADEHACGVEPCLCGRQCRDAREVLAAIDGAKP